MTTGSRPEADPTFAQRWPRWAFLGLTIATGFGMTFFALRCRNAMARIGIDAPLTRLVAVGCPALIGVAILSFGLALLRHGRRPAPAGERPALEPVGERGGLVRLTVFVVPIMVVTQMAAARHGSQDGAEWSTLVLAGLVPLVPMTIFAFAVVILSASRLFSDGEPTPKR